MVSKKLIDLDGQKMIPTTIGIAFCINRSKKTFSISSRKKDSIPFVT